MKTLFPLILLSLSILIASCTEEVRYSKEELYDKVKLADPTAQLLLPKTIAEGVQCGEYGEGCLSGHRVLVMGLELIAVEFANEQQSMNAAKRFRGYYTRNWLLDDVSGEPILERFVQEQLGAKKHP